MMGANLLKKISPEWPLRLGLGLMYLYSSYDIFYNTQQWKSYIPPWLFHLITPIISLDLFLKVQAIGEFVLALLLIAWFSGTRGVRVAAVLATVEMAFILLLWALTARRSAISACWAEHWRWSLCRLPKHTMEQESHKTKVMLAGFATLLLAIIAAGLVWFFTTTLSVQNTAGGLEATGAAIGGGWYLFSFAAGLTMIVLPCTLPLAFVIVPLSMGKGAVKGLGIAISFGLGVAITLSLYGIAAALIGKVAIGALAVPLEVIKNWLYFVAGTLAYLFALGELGLINAHMPTYTGAVPSFIQKQQDYVKALALGLFLGNVGVGCPHPATPFILGRIAVSGSVFYGWLLFFIHAVGRVLPLLFLALLAILGVNGLSWLIARKGKIEKATGWGMVFVAGFILVLGLFSHAWWVYSGQHTLLEELTQEEYFLGVIIRQFSLAGLPHAHGAVELVRQTGLFGLPLWLGNWALVGLWVFPLWWYYMKKGRELTI
ncbi:MAG: hypothetical protein HY006_03985 [Candidatus Sungbacteria bacterium]|nr:hypothetical protein [Candidatus Sungbacteria bacterium]